MAKVTIPWHLRPEDEEKIKWPKLNNLDLKSSKPFTKEDLDLAKKLLESLKGY